jgi:hypothetical protein
MIFELIVRFDRNALLAAVFGRKRVKFFSCARSPLGKHLPYVRFSPKWSFQPGKSDVRIAPITDIHKSRRTLSETQEKGPAHPGGWAEPFPNRMGIFQPDPLSAYQNTSRRLALFRFDVPEINFLMYWVKRLELPLCSRSGH